MPTRIQVRRDTSDRWESVNPVLGIGEPGYDTTSQVLKLGDGVTRWIDLDAADERAFREAQRKYELPLNGIPASALELELQQSLIPFTGVTDLTGVGAIGLGNSWVASPSGGVTQYVDRALAKLNAASYQNLATSGYRMQDTTIEAFAGQQVPGKAFPQNFKGIVVIGDLLNNGLETDTAVARTTALEGMRSTVALARSKSRIEQDTFAFSTSPAWGQLNTAKAWASGLTAAGSQAQNAVATFSIPGGDSYLVHMGTAGATLPGATVAIAQNGTALATKNLNNMYSGASNAHQDGVMQVVTKLTLAQGNRNIFTSTNASATGWQFIDALLPQHAPDGGPLVFLVKPLPVLNSGYQKTDLNTFLRTVPDTVAAEFGPSVVVVDPIAGWNPNTMLLADGLHPNEAGADYLGNFLADAIRNALLARSRRALLVATGLQ